MSSGEQGLEGRRAIVCGSTQGIGFAAAVELANRGASVTLVARNADSLAKAVTNLPTPCAQMHGRICVDFSDPATVASAVRADVDERGRAEILVNNSGGPPAGPILDATPEQFLAAFNQHLLCNHLLAQAVIPGMRDAGYGRIVNVISTSVREPLVGLGVSNTIRGAVASWAKTLSSEVAPFAITVNNVLPGATATGRLDAIISGKATRTGADPTDVENQMKSAIPAGRFGLPEEIANTIGFLASPDASYVTGQSIAVDGGRLRSL